MFAISNLNAGKKILVHQKGRGPQSRPHLFPRRADNPFLPPNPYSSASPQHGSHSNTNTTFTRHPLKSSINETVHRLPDDPHPSQANALSSDLSEAPRIYQNEALNHGRVMNANIFIVRGIQLNVFLGSVLSV